jgi:hypothetical protein
MNNPAPTTERRVAILRKALRSTIKAREDAEKRAQYWFDHYRRLREKSEITVDLVDGLVENVTTMLRAKRKKDGNQQTGK